MFVKFELRSSKIGKVISIWKKSNVNKHGSEKKPQIGLQVQTEALLVPETRIATVPTVFELLSSNFETNFMDTVPTQYVIPGLYHFDRIYFLEQYM